jgi:hypothetical protein
MGSFLDQCFSRSPDNAERFAECVMEKNKKLEAIRNPLEIKLLYFSKKANDCLSNGRSVSECSSNTTKGLSDMLAELRSNVDRL